jgi:tetratricopeptide (TPR) repeat protein
MGLFVLNMKIKIWQWLNYDFIAFYERLSLYPVEYYRKIRNYIYSNRKVIEKSLKALPIELRSFYYRKVTKRTGELEIAINYYKNGKYFLSAKTLSQILQKNPKSYLAYYYRGKINEHQYFYDHAKEDFISASKLYKNDPGVFISLGKIYDLFNELKNSITAYSKAIDLDPLNAYTFLKRAMVCFKTGNHSRAIDDLTIAINLNPKVPKFYNNRGSIYLYISNFEEAINDFNSAISLDPDYSLPYTNRANAFFSMKKYERAISDYTKVIDLNPNDFSAYENRGKVYAILENYSGTLKDWETAMKLNSNKEEELKSAYNYFANKIAS